MLKDLLLNQQATIAERWLDTILERFPGKSAFFFKKEKNRFANPLGYTLATETRAILEALLQGGDAKTLIPHVEPLAKISVVQEWSAGHAGSLLFALKDTLRAVLADELDDPVALRELADFDRRIDDAALLIFDAYAQCKERLCDIRVNEIKRTVHVLLRRARGEGDDPAGPERASDA